MVIPSGETLETSCFALYSTAFAEWLVQHETIDVYTLYAVFNLRQ